MIEALKGFPLFRRLSVQLGILLVALVFFSVGLFGLLAYQLVNSSLEDELGRRLVTVAKIGAGNLGGEDLEALVPRGKAYAGLQARLKKLARQSDLERLVLFDLSQRVLVDSKGELAWGETYHPLKLDLVEWRWVLEGDATDTPLFGGAAEGRMFKSALAPVVDSSGRVTGVLRAEADAAFLSVARALTWSMVTLGLISVVLAAGFAVWVSRPVVRPVNELIDAAKRVATGDFKARISSRGRGELDEAAKTFNEMTRQLEIFVKEKERMATLGELSAGVAHEIRNPLAAIEGFAGLLEKNLDVKNKQREHAVDILKEVRILNRFITDFLDFSRPSPPRLEVVGLKNLVESAVKIGLPSRSKKWKVGLSGPDTQAVVDPDQLRQVIINLIANARDAMPEGGKIQVRIGRKGGMASVEVEDHGKGMNKETRDKLFTPFFTTKPMGTGLGLAIAHKLLEGLHGEIKVRSELGKGSRFLLLLPHEMNASL